MKIQQLEKEYRIHVYETGPAGKVNLHSLFNFMQDIASEHAVILGYGREDLMKKNHFWVLSRMFASFNGLPSWKDTIVLRTWPSGVDKMFAMRHYELKYSDGRQIGSGSSSWLIIDRTTKKIQRPDEFLQRYNLENEGIERPVRNPLKLDQFPGEGTTSKPFTVTVNDLDINLHTNNVNYLKWITDTYDLNFIMNHQPCSAEINYLAEAMFGDEIIIRSSNGTSGPGFINHSVIRTGDNRELCRIKLEWEQNTDPT